jgi:RHS repeat-associated protein
LFLKSENLYKENAMRKLTASWPAKKASISVLVLICSLLISFGQTTPNYTETIIYDVDGSGHNVNSRTYTDGLGRELQTQTSTLNGNDAIITGKVYDEAGRPVKTSMPFKQTANPYLNYNDGDVIQQAKTAWGGDSAYSSVRYYDDPLNRAYATGAPGDSFALSRHAAKDWSFGITGTANPSNDFDTNGFILPAKLDTTKLNTNIPVALDSFKTIFPGAMKYYLSVSMDPNGHFTQVIKDQFGNILRTASSADGVNFIVSSMKYNLLGNKLSETPPQTAGKEVKSDTNQYNTAGEVLQKITPDAYTVFYQYNEAGQWTSVIDSNSMTLYKKRDSVIYRYDGLGRRVLTAEMFDSNVIGPRVRTVYDDTTGLRALLAACAGFPTEPDFTTLLSSLANTQGKVVAEIGYDENLRFIIGEVEPSYAGKVIKLYSYDDDGNVIAKYTSMPGMVIDLQKQFYTYDIHGKVLTVTHQIARHPADIVYAYAYDALGKVSTIKKNDTVFVTYTYDDYGRMTQKTFTVGGVNYPVNYTYSIQGWVKEINANSQFVEDLCYEENELGTATGFASQFNGNISRAKAINSTYLTTDMVYTYDKIDRLTNANNIQDSGNDNYDASFSFLDDGRILQKHEGDTAQSGWGDYAYKTGTNQLDSIANSPKRWDGNPNYIYDFNGNMVFDRSKKMSVEYDWRNMPVRFNIYDTILGPVATWDNVRDLASDVNIHRINEIVMTYDASGNRVKKEVVVSALSTCPDPNESDSSFVVTNDANGTTYKFKNDGKLQTCKAITSDMDSTESGALRWEYNDTTMTAFNSERLQIMGNLVENNATPESGNFQLYYEPASAPKFVDDQVTGNLEEAGQSTTRTVISGVAYLDGGRTFVYDQDSAKYVLSYTASAEGVVRSDGSVEVYVKDHLGSTRAVVCGTGQLIEVSAYFIYGAEQSLLSPQVDERARMKFTGKEHDVDAFINLTYFGKRYYDPEVGVWTAVDPKDQLFNVYGYSSNPISFIDPNGEYIIGAIIGALAGAYVGGAMANGSFNPANWNWNSFGTWSGIILGGISGAKMGDALEDKMWLKLANKSAACHTYGTYASHGYVHALITEPLHILDGPLADVWLEGPTGNEPPGHISMCVGDPLGDYSSYSFGVNGEYNWENWMEGEVYSDISPGGQIINGSYIKTLPEQDAIIKATLDRELGAKREYWFNSNCRTWSKGQWNVLNRIYGPATDLPFQQLVPPGSLNVPGLSSSLVK